MRILNSEEEFGFNQLFKSIYEEQFENLYSYALTITGTPDLAKDAVSEVFFDLLKSQRDLSHVKDIRAYLLKSVKNSCIKIISRDPIQFEKLQSGIETKLVEEIDPEEVLIGKELDQFLEDAIKSLSPQCQLIFNMVKLQGKKYEDVANELGISMNTVRNHLVSSLKHIRNRIEKNYDDHSVIRLLTKLGSIILILASVLYFI
tara:strand:+ start:318 stop:926 length:609 start_codon:yes stop_codon:yes gene_type:complete